MHETGEGTTVMERADLFQHKSSPLVSGETCGSLTHTRTKREKDV